MKAIRNIFFVLAIAAMGAALAGCQGQTQASLATPTMPTTADGASLVFIPAGEFQMGSALLNEQPIHTVYLPDYWMDKYEVTTAQYMQCMNAGKCTPPAALGSSNMPKYYGDPEHDKYPANSVNWSQADAFCRWAGRHLPTEAQWEKAARGTDSRIFPWGNDWDSNRVNSLFTQKYETQPVDSHPDGVSPYGIFNMAGNVWEWVADWYSETYYAHSPVDNPLGPTEGTLRIVRGGGYGVYDAGMRTSVRREMDSATQATYIGFRCAQ